MSGGGGGGPTQSTSYTTNLPEYAKPYVMNMLGAAQNQLFTTTPGADGEPGEITGFKPYTPYSTDPTKYFAGPTGLQTGVYNEAAGMQTPGQFGQASGMAGAAGAGQLGTTSQADMYGRQGSQMGQFGLSSAMPAFSAGQQYASQVTDPSAMGRYMSPYQQQVTDIAKQAAVREAQIAGQQANLGSARQGTYGGARQALAQAEREKNLLSNLSNIQAQGSQSAYDKAMQAQQFGANLGLQGIQTGLQGVQTGMQGIGQGLQGVGAQQAGYAGLGQSASTLGQLGTAQQQSDINRMNLQNQLGGQQQQYQQNIINQAIQDFATSQQYPYMQLSTMSNLLRGLPMQGMTTQQYQAQPSAMQQLGGLAGAYGAYKGAFKEGGSVQAYAPGGGIRASLENKIDDIAETGGVKGLQGLLAQTKSPQAKQMIMDRMREEGIGAAPTGGLGRNMAGGGIIAFSGKEGSQVEEMTDEEREDYIKNNAYLQRSRGLANLPAATGEFLRKYNPVTGSAYSEALQRFVNESPEDQATRFRKASSRKEQAANPTQEVPAVKTATQRKEDNDRDDALASVGQSTKIDYKKAEEILKASRPNAPAAAPKADNVNTSGVNPGGKSSMEDAYARYLKMTGQDQTPQEMTDYLNMLKQKSGKVGELSAEAGRMNKALAFLEAGQDPRGLLSGAVTGGKKYLQGEIANQERFQKMELDYGKAMSDYKKAELERAKGNYDAAAKYEDKAQDRITNMQIAQLQANKPGEFEKMYAVYSQNETDAGRKPTFDGFRKSLSASDETGRLNAMVKADTILNADMRPGGYVSLSSSKKPEDREKAAQMRRDLIAEYMSALGATQTAGAGGGNRLRFDASGKQI